MPPPAGDCPGEADPAPADVGEVQRSDEGVRLAGTTQGVCEPADAAATGCCPTPLMNMAASPGVEVA